MNDKKLENNLVLLDELSRLNGNWNGYGAGVFNENLINFCKNILIMLQFQPEVFPTGRNSIQFEFEKDGRYLELEIFSEDNISVLFINNNGKEFGGHINRTEIRNWVACFYSNLTRTKKS